MSKPELAIRDAFSRECLALIAEPSLSGLRVAGELPAIVLPGSRQAQPCGTSDRMTQRAPGPIWRMMPSPAPATGKPFIFCRYNPAIN